MGILRLVHAIIAVVAEDGELFLRHSNVVELASLGIALGAEEGARELDVPSAGFGGLVEHLHVVDPERTVDLKGEGGNAIVLTLLSRLGALIEPDLGVRDDEAIAEELIVLVRALHDSTLSW